MAVLFPTDLFFTLNLFQGSKNLGIIWQYAKSCLYSQTSEFSTTLQKESLRPVIYH